MFVCKQYICTCEFDIIQLLWIVNDGWSLFPSSGPIVGWIIQTVSLSTRTPSQSGVGVCGKSAWLLYVPQEHVEACQKNKKQNIRPYLNLCQGLYWHPTHQLLRPADLWCEKVTFYCRRCWTCWASSLVMWGWVEQYGRNQPLNYACEFETEITRWNLKHSIWCSLEMINYYS